MSNLNLGEAGELTEGSRAGTLKRTVWFGRTGTLVRPSGSRWMSVPVRVRAGDLEIVDVGANAEIGVENDFRVVFLDNSCRAVERERHALHLVIAHIME